MIRKHLPNIMTLGNLFCGCLAIFSLTRGLVITASVFVGAALLLDFFDGFTARLLKVSSAIGKDLDSLADMVTFGVVPGFYMFGMILSSMNLNMSEFELDKLAISSDWHSKLPFIAFLITVFSCLRLARFNNDPRQSEGFIGMPTPANTMLIGSLAILHQINAASVEWMWQPIYLVVISVILSLLLVAEVPLIALKFKNFRLRDNLYRYLLLGISVILLLTLNLVAIPFIMLLYILMSIVNNIFSKKTP